MPLDQLHIFLRDIPVMVRIGYYESEYHAPQPLIITLKLTLAALPDYSRIGTDLSRLLDYSRLHHYLTHELPQHPHIPFLESLADIILQHCWLDNRVLHGRVRIQKPEAIDNAPNIGIMLERSRPV